MRLHPPRTLFGKTVATIALVSAGFLLFTLAVIAKFLLVPAVQSSAGDLAGLMNESARIWAELPPERREQYAAALRQRYDIVVRPVQAELPPRGVVLPYFLFLESALEPLIGHPARLRIDTAPDGAPRYWATLPTQAGPVDMGISRLHIGIQPPLAVFLVITVGALVTMATAVFLVMRITAPIERLSAAARRLGMGTWPEPLPATGPEELAELTRSFNRMVVQVQELLANRTTLLAGISHDLRTPLARMQVALAMLPPDREPQLLEGLRTDLEQMNRLIGQFLEVARGLEDSHKVRTRIAELVGRVAENACRGGAAVSVQPGRPCAAFLPDVVLYRVLENLVDNAARYGGGNPVEIEWHCSENSIAIHVLDRGPGIPPEESEAVFRPFYRLERSRSRSTGGSGLGLAIARQLAQANDWDIRLLSRHGGGTRAVVNLGSVRPFPDEVPEAAPPLQAAANIQTE